MPRPARTRCHRRPLLGVLRRSRCRRRCHGRRTPGARTPQPAAARRVGQQLASADSLARVLEARSKLPAGEKRVARAQRSGAQGRSLDDLEWRWPQSERSADGVPSLRQCNGGQGSGRRSAEDGVGHRLSAVRADLLPARGGLRRLRQRRAPVEQPAIHGLPAHGRRVQLPRASAGEGLDGRRPNTGIEARRSR